MARRRHRRSASHLVSGMVVVGLLVGAGAVAASAVLARRDIGASPRPSTVAGTTKPVSALGNTARSERPLALVQAGDSRTACISGGPGPGLRQVESATRLTYNCIETFTNKVRTWAEWADPWITSSTSAPFVAWVAADPTGHQLIDTQDLIPASETTNPRWVAECAAGDYNTYATQFAKNMIAAGFGYSIIRLGAEMNGTWEGDSLGDNKTKWQQWGKCFAQEVKAMRAVPRAHFLLDWNINARYRDIPLADYYPGNAYVDIVGISLYDESGSRLPHVGSPGRWRILVSEPMGMNEVYAFAAKHHKPLSFPEWGTLIKQGDDGNYVANMGAFIASHDVAYQSWFNAGNGNVYQLNPTEAPNSVAAYIRTISRRVARSAAK